MDGQQEQTQSTPTDAQQPEEHSLLWRLEHHLVRRVSSGFLVLVPALITVWILYFVFFFVDGFFRPWVKGTPYLDFTGIGVIITLLVFYIIGSFFSGRRSQAMQDAVLSRIPVVRGIYGVARQATESIYSPAGHHFSRVVYVEWPRIGVIAMGFVMGRFDPNASGGSPLVAVYIPTVPNPTSGMLAFFPVEEITETDITVQDAMKTVFSGGIVLPEMGPHPGLPTSTRVEEGLDG